MQYGDLVEIYRRIESTSSTDEKTAILASALEDAATDELPTLLPLFRGRVAPAYERVDLGISSSLTTRAIAKATGVDTEEIEATWRETGDLGAAAATAVENQTQQTLFTTELTVTDVFETLRDLVSYEGEGSRQRRIDAVAKLLSSADPDEARYVVRTVLGHLRIGVGEGTVRDAIAQAYLDGSEGATESVEYAYQVTNDYPLVARTAREAGEQGLRDLEIELFRPLQVMLANAADSVEDGIDSITDDDRTVLASTSTTASGSRSTRTAGRCARTPGVSMRSPSSSRTSSRASVRTSRPTPASSRGRSSATIPKRASSRRSRTSRRGSSGNTTSRRPSNGRP